MKLLLFTSFIISSLFGATTLREKILKGEPGDFVVVKMDHFYSLLSLQVCNDFVFTLEEVTIPALSSPTDGNWQNFLNNNAPGHTAWNIYIFQKSDGQLLEVFSKMHSAYLPVDQVYLSSLLNTPQKKIPKHQQRKIGQPPPQEEIDTRKTWLPAFFINGKRCSRTYAVVTMLEWPNDNSPLSRKTFTLYFDPKQPNFPFPYWIECSTEGTPLKMQTIDSGTGLKSSTIIPYRQPKMLHLPKMYNQNLRFTLYSPVYFTEFTITAFSKGREKQQTWKVYPQKETEDTVIYLDVPLDEKGFVPAVWHIVPALAPDLGFIVSHPDLL